MLGRKRIPCAVRAAARVDGSGGEKVMRHFGIRFEMPASIIAAWRSCRVEGSADHGPAYGTTPSRRIAPTIFATNRSTSAGRSVVSFTTVSVSPDHRRFSLFRSYRTVSM